MTPVAEPGARLDKWLWSVRLFRTRSLATDACRAGSVTVNDQPAKPARDVHVGDRLKVTTEAGEFEIDVLELSEMRGPAAVAQALYRETEAGREARIKLAEEQKANAMFEPSPVSRPTKRDRRKIIQFRRRD